MLKTHTDIERALNDYDYIGKQIKALEAERAALRDDLVAAYFKDQAEYRDINGIVIATYKPVSREFIDGKTLKLTLPDVYTQYVKITTYNELRVK